jgi:hypothetical protein
MAFEAFIESANARYKADGVDGIAARDNLIASHARRGTIDASRGSDEGGD